MNETDAVVVRLDGEHAWIQAQGAGSACGACARQGSCHSLARGGDDAMADKSTERLLRLPNTIHARPGDAVVIAIADGTLLQAVWRVYGLPLMLAIAGAMGLGAWPGGELAAVGGMVLGLLLGFGILRYRGLDSRRAEPIFSISFKRTH